MQCIEALHHEACSEETFMGNRFGVLAVVASGCVATVAPGDEASQQSPTHASVRVVTADDLRAIAPGRLHVDLSRAASAVRFEDSSGPVDLSHVRIALESGEVTAADAALRIASPSFGRRISLNQVVFRARPLESLRGYTPDSTCTGALPEATDCCVCGSTSDPCPVFLCVASE
jgi:hypothetical protein